MLQLRSVSPTQDHIYPGRPSSAAGAQEQGIFAHTRLHLGAINDADIGHVTLLHGHFGMDTFGSVEYLPIFVKNPGKHRRLKR
jgi:hypothetical protein